MFDCSFSVKQTNDDVFKKQTMEQKKENKVEITFVYSALQMICKVESNRNENVFPSDQCLFRFI